MAGIRLKEVAAEAGVSISTAAAALRGESIVKAATREKVAAAAKKLGYRKHSAAALVSSQEVRASSKGGFIAFLTALNNDHHPDSNSTPSLVEAEAQRRGLLFSHMNIDDLAKANAVFRALESRGVDGILLGHTVFDELDRHPAWRRFAVVATERERVAAGFDTVHADIFNSMLQLLRRLKAAGYARIGVCLHEHQPIHIDDEERLGAATAFYEMETAPSLRLPVKRLVFGGADNGREMAEWARAARPDVVVGFSMWDFLGLREAGFSIPGDFAFASLHVGLERRGEIAGLQRDREVLPAAALPLLLQKVRRGMRGFSTHPQERVVGAPVLSGASCPGL